ncbi:Hemolysin, plasmid [Shewanella putrefaciens]|nr:Hemolysin, plasmid [Shewanella putrefaciens]
MLTVGETSEVTFTFSEKVTGFDASDLVVVGGTLSNLSSTDGINWTATFTPTPGFTGTASVTVTAGSYTDLNGNLGTSGSDTAGVDTQGPSVVVNIVDDVLTVGETSEVTFTFSEKVTGFDASDLVVVGGTLSNLSSTDGINWTATFTPTPGFTGTASVTVTAGSYTDLNGNLGTSGSDTAGVDTQGPSVVVNIVDDVLTVGETSEVTFTFSEKVTGFDASDLVVVGGTLSNLSSTNGINWTATFTPTPGFTGTASVTVTAGSYTDLNGNLGTSGSDTAGVDTQGPSVVVNIVDDVLTVGETSEVTFTFSEKVTGFDASDLVVVGGTLSNLSSTDGINWTATFTPTPGFTGTASVTVTAGSYTDLNGNLGTSGSDTAGVDTQGPSVVVNIVDDVLTVGETSEVTFTFSEKVTGFDASDLVVVGGTLSNLSSTDGINWTATFTPTPGFTGTASVTVTAGSYTDLNGNLGTSGSDTAGVDTQGPSVVVNIVDDVLTVGETSEVTFTFSEKVTGFDASDLVVVGGTLSNLSSTDGINWTATFTPTPGFTGTASVTVTAGSYTDLNGNLGTSGSDTAGVDTQGPSVVVNIVDDVLTVGETSEVTFTFSEKVTGFDASDLVVVGGTLSNLSSTDGINWTATFTPTPGFTGTASVTVTAGSYTDLNGNLGTSGSDTAGVDTQGPSVVVNIVDDVLTVGETSEVTFTFSEKVTGFDASDLVVVGGTLSNLSSTDGINWTATFTPTPGFTGTASVTVTAGSYTDLNGNLGTSGSDTAGVDTQGPSVVVNIVDDVLTVGETSEVTFTFSEKVTGFDASDLVVVGGTLSNLSSTDGINWTATFTPTPGFTGTASVTVTAGSYTDLNGNLGTAGSDTAGVDTQGPSVVVNIVDDVLTVGETSEVTFTFSEKVTGFDASDLVVVGGTLSNLSSTDGINWTATFTPTPGFTGTASVTVTAGSYTDLNGNLGTAGNDTAGVDTQGPSVVVNIVDDVLTVGETSEVTFTFSEKVTGFDASDLVVVGGTLSNLSSTDGINWTATFTPTPGFTGTASVTVTAGSYTDLNGNLGTAGSDTAGVDTQGPSVVVNIVDDVLTVGETSEVTFTFSEKVTGFDASDLVVVGGTLSNLSSTDGINWTATFTPTPGFTGTASVTVTAGSYTDLNGNLGTSGSDTAGVDTQGPSVVVNIVDDVLTVGETSEVTFTFSEKVTGFDASDLVVVGGTLSNLSSTDGINWTATFTPTPGFTGTASVTVTAGSYTDLNGNLGTSGSDTAGVDTQGPSVVVNIVDDVLTVGETSEVTFTFSEKVTGFDASDLVVVGGTLSNLSSTNGINWTATFTPTPGFTGTASVTVTAGSYTDLNGNLGTSGSDTAGVDTQGPSVVVNIVDDVLTVGETSEVTFTFSEKVTGFDASDLVVVGGTLSNLSSTDGINWTATFTPTPGFTGTASVTVTVGSYTDLNGNLGTSGSDTAGVDTQGPSVVVNIVDDVLTVGETSEVTFTFSEKVTGFDASDLVVVGGTLSNLSSTDGINWTATFTPTPGFTGTASVTVTAGSYTDLNGNLGTSGSDTAGVDTQGPSVVVNIVDDVLTVGETSEVTFTFSEKVTGFDASDLVVVGGTLSNLSSTDGINWTATFTPTPGFTGTASVTVTAGSYTDLNGNLGTAGSDTAGVDTQGPSVVVNIVDDVLTVGETSEVTFTFSEKVTGFDASDLVVVGGTLSNLSSTDGINWTATFTPTPGFTGTASVTVTAGSYTDLNGNLGTAGSDTAGVDTQGPSVVVNIVDDVLTVGETSEVTFTFSEKVTGFDASDLVVVGGTLSNLSSTDGINWTATFTPTPGFTGTASVTVTAGSYTDLNGNLGTAGNDTAGVDTQGPSVVVNIVDDVLTVGETSEVTFTFSEKVTGFDASDLVVVGGTLSNLSSTDGINWTATFTPTPGFTGTASVTVTAGSYTDLNGNLGTAGSDTAGVDTQGPSVVVNIVDDVLTVGETSEVTFTFSEKVTGFDASDLVVVGGTLSNLSSTDGINWTATFTPTPGFTGTASVTVTAGSYTDLNGNLGTAGNDTAGVDTQGPSVVVNIVDDVLTVGETSEVTFTFSEKVTGFDASDLVVVGGTLSNLSSTDGINWTATFTPTPGFTGTASVTVTAGSYTDLNGNLGTAGNDTAGVDTQGPSVVVNIVDDVLTVGETSEVTFTFSEKVTGFDASDLVVVGGTLSNLSSTDGINWTATFTPTPGFTGTASVTVTAGSYTDLNGNLGTSGSDTAGVDTQGPSVVVNIVDDVLTVGETSEVTFTFSEKVTGFDASDLVVVGGTLSNLSSTDGINWTATFTPTPGFTGTASVTVTAGSYTDLNGNLGTSGSDTAGVDTQGPSVVVNIVDDVLTVGETSEVTFTFSEKVTGFDASDLVVVGGTLSNLSSTDGINWTATFTPTPGFTGTASVTVTAGSYTDLNGNLGTAGSDTAGVDTQGPSVVVNIVDDVLTVGETSEVTFTFSEKVTGFDASDLVVVGGTLSNLSSTDGINWTATFTPTPGFTGTASVTVTAGSYTDLNGNLGTAGSDTAGVDTQGPSVVVNIVDDVLTVGETSEVTFTFSEKVTGFDASDLVVVGGTLSNLSSTDGINWTATFTPTPGFTGTASVTVTAGSYTDLNGNLGTAGNDTAGVDTQGPSVVVNIVDDVLTVGETSEVTFTFSEKVTGFDASDLVVVGGTLSNLSSTDGINWTATFTPTPGFTGTASVTVTAGSYTDLNGNLGTAGSDTAGVDTQGPSVVVNIVDDVLTVGETSEVTFTFSEKVTGFDASDLVVVGGTLSNLSSTDGINWTATFTPTPGFTGTASVTVTAGSYTDLNGNLGTAGNDTAGVDTQGPSVVVNIVDDVLTVGETSEVTFTFSEKVTGFDASDLVVVGGTLSNLSSTDGINWTATFTPTPGFTGTASVTVTAGSYTDLNGNLGTAGNDTAGVDTQGPSVVVNIVDDVLTVGETSEVTFTFSEKVTGFDASDLVVVGGTLSNLSSTDGINWTATFTPTPGFTGTASVTVTAGSYTDLNGNLGTAGNDTAGVDTQGPSVVVNIVDDVLTVGETSEVTFTFSEKVTGFDASDLVVVGGTLSNLSSTDGINWTATFTPTPGFTGTASVTVTAGSYTDLNGNLGTSGSDTAGVDTQGPSVVVNIVDDVLTVGETSEVTFTFSEKVTGFDASDLVVVGGTLSNLSSTDGINWTATFTPTPGFTGTASVTVTAGSYTDLNGNLGTAGNDTAGVDTQGPSVVVNIVDDVLTVGETSEVTFTFSEKVTGFDASDLVVVGGTLSNLSSTDGINWTATFTPTPGFTGTASVTVTAGSYTDLNGNLGTAGNDTAGVDTQGPSVVVNIVDDVLTVGETSEVTFTFSEKVTGFDASDLVVVGGTLSNLSSTDGINWTATFTPTPGFTGTASVTVTAGSYTDLNGNLGTAGNDTAGVDTQGPSVVVNIVDDVLTVGETSEVTFTFSEKVTGFDASDLVVVGGTLSNLSSTDGINWTATFTPTPGFTGTASVTVTAGSYTDLNGNLGTSGSDTAGVDTQGPSVVVNIVDDVLTVGETSEVTFTFSEKVTGFDASDLVVVGGTLSNLSSTDGINWTATFTPTPGFTGTASVTVTAGSYTDLNGNLGTSGVDTAGVDTSAPNTPTVLIVDDGNPGDGLLTAAEMGNDGVQLTVSINGTDFEAGGYVTLTIDGGAAIQLSFADFTDNGTGTLTYGNYTYANGVISWTETAPADGQSITVTATQTDKAGNTSAEGSDTALVDTTAPTAPTVLIVDDANPDDGLLTAAEMGNDGVQLTVSINGTDFEAGGYVTLTINGGAAIELSFADFTDNGTGTLTYGNYTYANGVISWTETAPADGQSITVTATQTDKAGNTSAEGSDTALVDTTAPTAPTVLIVDDANPDDGLLTAAEMGNDGVQLTVSINGTDFEAGGYVTLTINGGAAIELSFADFTDNGTGTLTYGNYTYANGVISWTETAPADGQSITVTATQTDKAGNTSAEGSDTALVDTTAPTAPTVLIVDDANPDDGLLTAAEMGNDGVQLTVSINGTDFEAGGYVTLTINGGAAIELSFADFTDNGTGTLTYGNYTYANGVISWTETAPADGQSITVTATQTDKAGNTSAEGSDTALVDTTAPTAPTVLIVDDANPDDGLLTAAEMGNDGVQLTVSINGTDFEAGGYVTLTINGGAAIELSFADFTDNGTGTLTYGNYTYANGVISWTETAPADGQSITVTATQTDKAGNTSAEGSDTALVDTTAPTAPTVLIVDDANPDDGLLTAAEMGNDGVQLTVSINGTDFEAGGYVTLTINGGAAIELSFADFTDNGTGTLTYGNYTYANGVISWTETAPADGQSITVTATQTDKAGNTSAEGSDTALVDTTAPTAPTVLIVDDANPDDGLLTAAEMGNDGVQLTVSINGTDFEAGGYVTLTINGGAAIELSFADFTDNGTGTLTYGNYTYANGVISWTETAPADGQSITVTATQTDKAGNTSAEGSDTALVDTTAPTAPTVLIVDDANPDDGLLTQGEIDGNGAGVQLTVSIDAEDFSAGGHVNLTIVNAGVTTNVELKLVNGELQFANGNPATGYSYNATTGVISWTETRPADGALLKVEATQTDKAGNTSDKGSDQATVIYTSDDSFTKQEDQLVTGQLLTNDHSSNTSIVSFTVMYNGTLTSFNAGQTVALSIGSLLIQANGEFKFIPNQHWSGDVSTVTYTTNTGDTATLNITVQPVADKPLVDVILTANGTPLYSGFISSGITTEQFRNGDFTHQPFNTGAKQTDASSGQDTVYGSNGNDHIVSTNGGGDHLLGYAGNDVLVGGDAIQGDTINGGIGNDILVAGLGQDSLYGGEGNDIAVLMGNRADYIITKDYRYSQWDNWFNFTTIEHGQTITKALHDIEYIQFDDGIYELDKNTGELVMVQPTYVDYPVEIHASLTDRDGSELLDSIELSGLPAGTQVFYNGQLLGVADNDGKLLLDYDGPDGWTGGNLWAENALDATLTGVTIRVPGTSAGQVDLVVEAVAREKGTDLTNSATGEDTIRLDYFKGTEGEPGDQNVNFGSEHNIVVGDLDGSIVLPGQNYNIAFMVDSSGSINADTLETMKLQLAQVLETLKDSASGQQSGTVKIFLVDFDTHAKGSISVDLSDPNALDILQDALDDMSSGGGTNYEDVFTTTANWFANGDAQNNSGATNLAFFITDGKPTYYNAVPGGNPLVYDTWGSNNDRSLSQLIGSGYVFGQVYTVNGHVVIDENGNVFSVDVFNSVSRSPVGAMRPDAQGNYQYYALAGNGRDSSADTISNSQAGFALLSSLGVTVQAIGMGSNIDEDDLLPYDSDDNVQTNVDADDLADAILGDQVNAIPGADRFDGGAGDDVIFGDAIHFTGISGQGFAAIKAYVADKLGIADASDAQVHRYISEHSDEFDQSGANDKADIILGGAGNDILFGQGGNDYLDGGAGKDTLYGGNGNDTLIGGAGNDTLIGGAGNDTLIGGLGDDVLRGDSGNDTFVWRYADADKGTDHIMDFNVSEDKLDLSDLLQGETAGTLESYLNFSLDSNGSTVIDIDANKDGVFDQHIVLDGVNLYSQYGATDNAGIINGLLGTNGNGPLIIDAAPVTPDAPQGVTPLIDPHNNGTMIP